MLAWIEIQTPEIAPTVALLDKLAFQTPGVDEVTVAKQGAIRLVVIHEPTVPILTISGMGLHVKDVEEVYAKARAKGYEVEPYMVRDPRGAPVYLEPKPQRPVNPDSLLQDIDHLAINVQPGRSVVWAAFFQDVFDFTADQVFEIEGESTGFMGRVVRAPHSPFSIVINEPREDRSQIADFINKNGGEGVQHIAFTCHDVSKTAHIFESAGLSFIEAIKPPQEGPRALILRDGEGGAFLDQTFTRNIMGPLFIELIERKGYLGFGERNITELFKAVERQGGE